MFEYNGSDKVELDDIEIEFSRNYFNGLVSGYVTNLSDLDNYYIKRYIALFEGAQALTSEQVEKFRTYLKKVKEDSGRDASGYYIGDRYVYELFGEIRSLSYYQEYDQFNFELDELNDKVSSYYSGISIDDLSDDELKVIYVGYLNRDTIYIGCYDEDGNYESREFKGGRTSNAIGLDSGEAVMNSLSLKIYYAELFKAVNYSPIAMKDAYYTLGNSGGGMRIEDGIIVGFYLRKNSSGVNYRSDSVVINDTMYAAAQSFEPIIYTFFIAPMPTDRATIETLVDLHYDKSGSRGFSMQNGVTLLLDQVNDILAVLGTVFLYVGLGLAIFSMLLMSNYIAVSISYKKREIGILRAVGAKSSDVFSIFFSESLIIALINFVLSMIVSGVGCMLLNNMMRSEYGIQITLLNFGIRQIALMLLISVVVAIVSSFVPVYKLSRKKPIETIRTA
ncbi:MAG: FtsX-like permease family protein [Clostridiales bacterium]|nr:FtsX-like permease family protein [Clostridiales bacterium]